LYPDVSIAPLDDQGLVQREDREECEAIQAHHQGELSSLDCRRGHRVRLIALVGELIEAGGEKTYGAFKRTWEPMSC